MWQTAAERDQTRATGWRRLKLWWLLLLAATGCQGTAPVIKIGLVAPFEGQHRAVGYDVIYSARLAVREMNLAGGIGGYRVELVALDDAGDPELAQQAAASLALDSLVVAVVGHWLSPTTAAAAAVYAQAGLPLLAGGVPPLQATSPERLPASFQTAYAAVTPFDEQPGPYAGAAYDAFQLLEAALARAAQAGEVDRAAMTAALANLEITGFSGLVFQSQPENYP